MPSSSYTLGNPPVCYTAATTNSWYLDTGTSNHMTANLNLITTPIPYTGSDHILVSNGQSLPITNTSNAFHHSLFSNSNFLLRDVLHVPKITKSLLSVQNFTTDNHVILNFGQLIF